MVYTYIYIYMYVYVYVCIYMSVYDYNIYICMSPCSCPARSFFNVFSIPVEIKRCAPQKRLPLSLTWPRSRVSARRPPE